MKRRTKPEHRDLLYKVADLFYIQKYQKSEIADKLHMSATHIARLLEQAETEGIVKVDIRIMGRLDQFADDLKKKYDLREVQVVERATDYRELQKALGVAAAHVLEDRISREARTRVGISGGPTLQAILEALDNKPRTIDVYPMSLFGRGPEVEYVDSVFLSMLLFMKSRPLSRGFIVGVPPLPSKPTLASRFAKMILEEIPEVEQVLEGAKSVDIAFIGAGAFISSKDIFLEYGKLGMTFEKMQAEGVAGGINYNYFDNSGSQVGAGVLTVSVSDLKQMSADPWKIVTLVAGGGHKLTAIRIAVEQGMVNGLVTDEDTALSLLSH